MERGTYLVVTSTPGDERRQTRRLWYALEHVFGPWHLKIVLRNVGWDLMIRCPVSDRFKVTADVLCVEIREGLWVFFVPPDLTEESNVDCTHQLLPKDVHTVCWKRLVRGFIYRFEREREHQVCSLIWDRRMWPSFLNAPVPCLR